MVTSYLLSGRYLSELHIMDRSRSVFQTKLGRLFLKKKTARSGASQVEQVLVELTSARLIIRAKEEGHPRNEDPFIEEERHVTIVKDSDGNVGISLEGGVEMKSFVTISSVSMDSPAHASGQVFKGDAILTINGSDVTRMTVNEVAHLIATSRRKVTLHLARPSSEGRDTNAVLDETRVREELLVKEVVLEQDHNGIGLTIKGGADLKSPLRVDKIINHSPAHRCGQINHDDILLAVNDVDTRFKSIREIVNLIAKCGRYVTLQLGYPKDLTDPESGLHGKSLANEELPVVSSIPLSLAYITRYEKGTDQLKANAFVIWASDGSFNVELHGPQSQGDIIEEWIDAIRNNIRILNEREAFQMNEVIGAITKVTLVGWVSERLPSASHCQTWSKKFLVMRSDALEIYNSPPETVRDWCQPESVLKLSEFSVEILKGRSQPNLRSHSMCIRSGKGHSHVLSFECNADLSLWTKTLHTTTNHYVMDTKSRQFKGKWKEQLITLVIDINRGIIFEDASTKTIVFQKPFTALVGSSDDQISRLKLMFLSNQAGRHEVQTVILDHLQLVVSCLETFLTVKVAQADPSFVFSPSLSIIAV